MLATRAKGAMKGWLGDNLVLTPDLDIDSGTGLATDWFFTYGSSVASSARSIDTANKVHGSGSQKMQITNTAAVDHRVYQNITVDGNRRYRITAVLAGTDSSVSFKYAQLTGIGSLIGSRITVSLSGYGSFETHVFDITTAATATRLQVAIWASGASLATAHLDHVKVQRVY